MTHRASRRFWRCYRGLPKKIQDLADQSYALIKSNPAHPSLHFKKIGKFWSARVGLHYRALAVETGEDLVWFWIGSHPDYDRLLGSKPTQKATPPASRGPGGAKRPKRSGRARR